MAWAHFEFPEDLFNGETVEEWVPLNGRQGNGEEGNINIILSLQVRMFVVDSILYRVTSAFAVLHYMYS